MKKLFALLLALILGIFSSTVATKTIMTNPIDTPTETKIVEWSIGYAKRCGKYRMKNVQMVHNNHPYIRRIALAPLTLFVGVASAEPTETKLKPVSFKKLRQELDKKALEIEELKAKLQQPAKSSKYRQLLNEYNDIAAEIAKKQISESESAIVALGYTPKMADDLVMLKYDLELHTDELIEKEYEAFDEKCSVFNIVRAYKEAVDNGTYSKADLDNAIEYMKLCEETHNSIKKSKNIAAQAERDCSSTIKALKQYGNAAVKATIKAKEAEMNRKFKLMNMLNVEIRELETINERCKKNSFQLPSWDSERFLTATGLLPCIKALNAYHGGKNSAENELKYDNAIAAMNDINEYVESQKPIRLYISNARPTRIQENLLSLSMRIDTKSKHVQTEWINVQHGLHEALNPHWKLFSSDEEDGKEKAKEWVSSVYEILDNIEVVEFVTNEDGVREEIVTKYKGLYSSASHQKQEKLVLCKEELMEAHERLVWFGKTKAEIKKTACTGAEIWKMRANLARPIVFALKTKDGRDVYLHNYHVVSDKKKTYHHKNGLLVGGKHDGKVYEFGEIDNPVIIGDGEAIAFEELNTSACQGGGCGVKHMLHYKGNADVYAAKKHGLESIKLPEGKLIVMGEGCFKFDKVGYESFDEFAAEMDKLASKYPGINKAYALRQSEEVEDDVKIRRVSRSFMQQLLNSDMSDFYKLAETTIRSLNYQKTFEGLFASLAELGKPEEKRSKFSQLVYACPGLLTNKIVQMIGEKKYRAIQNDAIGNKVKTKGQYPYIIQDPVALIEVWLLGCDPDDPNLGVLKVEEHNGVTIGEVSLCGVTKGKYVVGLRYPANFMTARILVNNPYTEIFGKCGNVAVLSVHDIILIVQDGDVDGDEMGIFYDKTIVKMVWNMLTKIKPVTVVFEHGEKAARETIEAEAIRLTEEAERAAKSKGQNVWKVYSPEDVLKKRMNTALWSAKEYDSVGKYANLARDCAYAANIELRRMQIAKQNNDEGCVRYHFDMFHKYMLWMAMASTGAILAIDQVKGNKIDPDLIAELDKISKEIGKMMCYEDDEGKTHKAQPFTQSYVKNDFTIDCLAANKEVNTDQFGMYVYNSTGEYSVNGKEFVDNNEALKRSLLDNRYPLTSVRTNPLTSGLLAELRDNYFNRSYTNERGETVNPDAEIFKAIKAKKDVSQKDILLMYWRNACTFEFRMQEKTTAGKKEEYAKMVRDSLIKQALDYTWEQFKTSPNYEAGHIFTKEEKIASVVNNAIIDALELNVKQKKDKNGNIVYERVDNGVSKVNKASYAKFVLSVFAEDVAANIERNNVDIRLFMTDEDNHAEVAEAGYDDADYSEILSNLNEDEADEDTSVLDDGSIWIGGCDDDDDNGNDLVWTDPTPAEYMVG